MGRSLLNVGEQKLQYLPSSWGIAREVDNMGARLVEYDDAMRKGGRTFWIHTEETSDKGSG